MSKKIECFSNYLPTKIFPNILYEEIIKLKFDEIVKDKDFERSPTEIETYESIEELKYHLEIEDGGVTILDGLNEKEMYDFRLQAMFKRSTHSIFISFHNQSRLLQTTKENG